MLDVLQFAQRHETFILKCKRLFYWMLAYPESHRALGRPARASWQRAPKAGRIVRSGVYVKAFSWWFGFAVVLSLATSARTSGGPNSSQLALTHVAVIDSTGSKPRLDQTVVIVNGRIAATGPSARIKMPREARVID